jgi:predicted transglutaminase-like cysteine proteinase
MRVFALMIAGSLFGLAPGMAGTAHASQWIRIGGETSIPYGHLEFCGRNPGECQGQSAAEPASFAAVSSAMAKVNASVNATFPEKTDNDIYGAEDVWAYPERFADCEDFALLKRRRLIDAGIAPANLPLTMVKLPGGTAHIVVTVRTDRGDFVLDNLTDTIKPWRQTGYRFLKLQSPQHAGHWRDVAGGSDTPVS